MKGRGNLDFEVMETEHFLFHCYMTDRDIVAGIASKVEEAVLSALLVFSAPSLSKKLDFYICPDVESYIKLTGIARENYQSWMVGNADYKKGRVCVISPRAVTDRSEEDMSKVIVHEAVHIAMDSLSDCDNLSPWISEGIAVLFADQTVPENISEHNYPKLCDLSGDDFASNGGYQYSGIYVRYFMEKFGVDEFLKVYKGEKSADEYLYDGFEADAIKSYKNRMNR